MAKYCMEKGGPALYLDCQECESRSCENFYCLVVGSRTFNDYSLLREKLDIFLKNHTRITIVSGGARGADSLARLYAQEKGYDCIEFFAEWDKYGKKAGWIRNEKMHDYISKAENRGVVAFWQNNSKGTAQNFDLAKKYNNPIRIIRC